MILVGKLTELQKTDLEGQLVQPDWYFYPVLDGNTPPNWVISTEEINASIYPQNEWVKNLPLIEWVEPIIIE
jgi:hypothetical protein